MAYPPVALPKTQTEYREAILQAWRLGFEAGKPKPYKPKPGDGWNSLFYCFCTMSFLLAAPIAGVFLEHGYFPNSVALVWVGLASGVSGVISVFCAFMERKVRRATGKS